jgi:hypothetical protein
MDDGTCGALAGQKLSKNRTWPAGMVLLENFGPAFAEAASRRQGGTFYGSIQSAELK